MRLTDIQADTYRRLGFNVTPPAGEIARILAYINETQREILRHKHFRRFRRRLITAASVASSPFMALPQAAVRIFGISDRTNDYLLEEKPLLWIRSTDPALRATAANPWAYAIYDLASPVARQPADASQLFALSTSAADTGQTAYLESIRTGGTFDVDSKVLNGAVGIGFTRTDTISVGKFYLSAVGVGTITLVEDSAIGTVLATIPIGRTFARYSLLHLYPTPSASSTYYVDIEVHVEDMANANDEPILPEEFHHLLGLGARAKEYEKREKLTLVRQLQDEMRNEVSKLKTWVNQQSGLQSPGTGQRRYSQLGPWYPDGT